MMLPTSINFHITQACNYHCKFCFGKYDNCLSELSFEECAKILSELAQNGCQKINFAGGEPTLKPFLPDLICYAKNLGLFVSVISNGTGITPIFLQRCGSNLDLLGVSVDSASDLINNRLGRTVKHDNFSHVAQIRRVAQLARNYNISLKVNTTITPLNWDQDMHALMAEMNPIRWKVFQVHPISGINDKFFKEFGKVSQAQFLEFISHHEDLNPRYETNEVMEDSYFMITPDGKFYQNSKGKYHYSEKILEVGLLTALDQVQFNISRFIRRDGIYYRNFQQYHKDIINTQEDLQEEFSLN